MGQPVNPVGLSYTGTTQDFGGGFEVGFGGLFEDFRTFCGDEFFTGFFNQAGGSFWNCDAVILGGFINPVNKLFAGENGGGGYGDVGLGFGALLQFDFSAVLFGQGRLQFSRVGELITQGAWAIRLLFEQVGDDGGVSPSQEFVEVGKVAVEFVVFLRSEHDDFADDSGRFSNLAREFANLGVGGDSLAVHDAGIHQGTGNLAIRVGTGDDERAEKISFATLVDSKMRGKHLGIGFFFVAEFGFLENFRLEHELYKIFGRFSLDQDFGPLFIYGDVELFLFRRKNGVWFLHKLVASEVEDRLQFVGLFPGDRTGISCQGAPMIQTTLFLGIMGDKNSEPDNFKEVFSDEDGVASFQKALVRWFQKNGKDYPWRRTHDPYAVLVSELMLQQTRIQTVLERRYFENWMSAFPNCKTLAEANEAEVLKAWEGLGYYNRARNLQKAARVVMEEHGGKFPGTLTELEALPGVGRYTAGAVMSFAYGKHAPIVDGNVIRVLARIFSYNEPVDTTIGKNLMWEWADRLTPQKQVREYNSGIMELGQQICSKISPGCLLCPVEKWCQGRLKDSVENIPFKKGKTKVTEVVEHVLAITDKSGEQIWLTQESGSRRGGLWRLPEISSEEAEGLREIYRSKYAITRYRVTLVVYAGKEKRRSCVSKIAKKEEGNWFSLTKREHWPPLGAPYLKVLKTLKKSLE